jgi:GMP synthase-like glutamine amidotransferase
MAIKFSEEIFGTQFHPEANPTLYSNYGNLQTGKVLSIIGLVLGLLFLVFIVVLFSAIGLDALQDEALMKARIEELFGQ